MTKKTEKAVFDRQDFLKLPEPEVHKVWIESLNSHVYLKEMTATDLNSFSWSMVSLEEGPNGKVITKRDMTGMQAKYLVRMLCDSRGNRLFKDEEWELIGQKSPKIVGELHKQALIVNKDTMEDKEEELKNSDISQEGDSSSDSV